jgi:hypothetical protein
MGDDTWRGRLGLEEGLCWASMPPRITGRDYVTSIMAL